MQSEGGHVAKAPEPEPQQPANETEKVPVSSENAKEKPFSSETEKVLVSSENAKEKPFSFKNEKENPFSFKTEKEEPFSFKNVQPVGKAAESDTKNNQTAIFTFGGHQFEIPQQQRTKRKSTDETKQDDDGDEEDAADDVEHAHDPWFEPIIHLPLIEIKTCEEDEEILLRDRARMYRFGPDDHDKSPQWKERGTGDVKLLKDRQTGMIRLLMRRDYTHSICANHYVYPAMELRKHGGSEKAFVWQTLADFADGLPKEELMAIRFRNKESAENFRNSFNSARDDMARELKTKPGEDSADQQEQESKLVEKVDELKI